MGDVKDAMDSITFEDIDFPTHPIPYTMMYVQWEANIIISKQLIRNLAFAFATIAIVNLILIADIVVSLLVFLCVVLTILDIVGSLYFMGLTIEIVTSVQLILSVGLALDYSAHIGVTYIVTRARDRKLRTQETLNDIGTAVFNGGFSTFLAFVLIAFSDSYIFLVFFKVLYYLGAVNELCNQILIFTDISICQMLTFNFLDVFMRGIIWIIPRPILLASNVISHRSNFRIQQT